nr:IS3 family transposase [Enorma massiliensis]
MGQGGRRRGLRPIGQPLPGRRGEPQAEARERTAEEGERDAFESERLLRRQAAVGSRAEGAKFALMLLDEGVWAISGMCSAPGAARQGCHAWRKRPPSAHDGRDGELAAMISKVRAASRGVYGAPKAFQGLGKAGARTSRKRAARIMRESGWAGATRGCARRPKGGAKQATPQPCAAPDPVRRDFSADGQDRLRFADITYARTHRGWLYPAVAMDVWPRMTAGWSMSASMAAELAEDAPKMAMARRRPGKGCAHRSDHGPRYASLPIGKAMREAGIEPSTGSISSPWDNAAMESLMGVIKAECMHARAFESRERAALEILGYIECFHNRARTHSALGYLSPEEFERANRPEDDRRLKAA